MLSKCRCCRRARKLRQTTGSPQGKSLVEPVDASEISRERFYNLEARVKLLEEAVLQHKPLRAAGTADRADTANSLGTGDESKATSPVAATSQLKRLITSRHLGEPLVTYDSAFQALGGDSAVRRNRERSLLIQSKVGNPQLDLLIQEFMPPDRKGNSTRLAYQDFVFDCDELYKKAFQVLDEFNKVIQGVADRSQGKAVLCKRLKDKKRAKNKAAYKYRSKSGEVAWYRLNDLVRGTIQFDTVDDMYSAAEMIVNVYSNDMIEFNDRYQQPLRGGYRDLQMTMRQSGHICELQLNTKLMLEAKEKSGHRNYDVQRELEPAIREGDLNRTRSTLEWGAVHIGSVEGLSSICTNLLLVAASSGFADIVSLLLTQRADANKEDQDGNTPAHLAVRGGHDSALWALISIGKADLIKQNLAGLTPLLEGYLLLRSNPTEEHARAVAIVAQSCGLAHVLAMKAQVEDEVKKRLYQSSDLVAFAWAGRVEKMKDELQNFASPNSRDTIGMLALGRAAEAGHCSAIHLLMLYSASPLLTDSEGRTPLHIAVEAGMCEAACALLHHVGNACARSIKIPVRLIPKSDRRNYMPLVLDHASDLINGQENVQLSLSLADLAGFVLGPSTSTPHEIAIGKFWLYRLVVTHPTTEPMRATYDGNFITCFDDYVFDIDGWKNNADIVINAVRQDIVRETRKPDGGRDFNITLDGMISPKHAPELVLGVDSCRLSRVILISKTSASDGNAPIVLENAEQLARGDAEVDVKLTLKGFPELGVVQGTGNPCYGEWSVIRLAVGDVENVMRVSYDGNFLTCSDGRVFDVAGWQFEDGNEVLSVRGSSESSTRKSGGGRDFIINPNGTISPKPAPQFVLGFCILSCAPYVVTHVFKDSDKKVCDAALQAFNSLGPSRCVASTRLFADLEDDRSRFIALQALRSLCHDTPYFVPSIVDLFAHENPIVQHVAGLLIGELQLGISEAMSAMAHHIQKMDGHHCGALLVALRRLRRRSDQSMDLPSAVFEALQLEDSKAKAMDRCYEQLSAAYAPVSTEKIQSAIAHANALGLDSATLICPPAQAKIILSDRTKHHVLALTLPEGSGEIVAGGNGIGTALDQVHVPQNVIVDTDGSILVAEEQGCRTLRFRPGQSLGELVAGGNGKGSELNQTHDCCGLAIERDGSVLVVEYENDRVTRWRAGATQGEVVAGGNGSGARLDQLNKPHYVVVDIDGSILVCDKDNQRVLRFQKGMTHGEIVAGGLGKGDSPEQLAHPHGVALDIDGSILVADTGNHRVVRFRRGEFAGKVVAGGRGPGQRLDQLTNPIGLKVEASGSFLVADAHRILRFFEDEPLGELVYDGSEGGNCASHIHDVALAPST